MDPLDKLLIETSDVGRIYCRACRESYAAGYEYRHCGQPSHLANVQRIVEDPEYQQWMATYVLADRPSVVDGILERVRLAGPTTSSPARVVDIEVTHITPLQADASNEVSHDPEVYGTIIVQRDATKDNCRVCRRVLWHSSLKEHCALTAHRDNELTPAVDVSRSGALATPLLAGSVTASAAHTYPARSGSSHLRTCLLHRGAALTVADSRLDSFHLTVGS